MSYRLKKSEQQYVQQEVDAILDANPSIDLKA